MTKEFVLVYCHDSGEHQCLILVLKNRPAWMAGRFNLPGGGIEPGETPEQAAHREVLEETGYKDLKMVPVGMLLDQDKDRNLVVHCFSADLVGIEQEPKPRDGETEQVDWHWWEKAVKDDRLLPNLRVIVPMIEAGVTGWTIRDNASSLLGESHEISVTLPKVKP